MSFEGATFCFKPIILSEDFPGIPGFPSQHLPLSMATPYVHHRALADAIAHTCHLRGWQNADVHLQTHTIHVWYIYLHLVDFYGECR